MKDPEFVAIRNELVEHRHNVLTRMREIANKLERGNLNFGLELDQAAESIVRMRRIVIEHEEE